MVTSPALILWQSTRHHVAEKRYSGKLNTNKTNVDGILRYQRWARGMVYLFLASLCFVLL